MNREDVENRIVGAVLVDPECWAIARDIVKSTDFRGPGHSAVIAELFKEGWSEDFRDRHGREEARLHPHPIDARELHRACTGLRIMSRGMMAQDIEAVRTLCDEAIQGNQDAWWLVKRHVAMRFEIEESF